MIFLFPLVALLNVGTAAARRAKPGSCGHLLTRRSSRHFLPFSLFDVRFQKALRHTLHAAVPMRLLEPSRGQIKLQHPMLHRAMHPFANVTDLNAPSSPVLATAHSPRRKPHRIPRPLLRQPSATLRVPKIAELPQLFLRWGLTLMPRRRALPTPPASQRKPAGMQPRPVL
jgi:hypothetical protein